MNFLSGIRSRDTKIASEITLMYTEFYLLLLDYGLVFPVIYCHLPDTLRFVLACFPTLGGGDK